MSDAELNRALDEVFQDRGTKPDEQERGIVVHIMSAAICEMAKQGGNKRHILTAASCLTKMMACPPQSQNAFDLASHDQADRSRQATNAA